MKRNFFFATLEETDSKKILTFHLDIIFVTAVIILLGIAIYQGKIEIDVPDINESGSFNLLF